MSTSYAHFTIEEREKLLQFIAQGLKQSEMAWKLGRNRRKDGSYSACEAEEKYRQRRKCCVRKRRLDDPKLKAYVTEKLEEYWSPEQIDMAGSPEKVV